VITTLDVTAFLFVIQGCGMAGFSLVFRAPRLMTAALVLTWLSLFSGAASASCQQHWLTLGQCLAGSLVTGLVAWRTWPDGWDPWRMLLDGIETGRLLRR
jgi:hypothetical protein